MRVCVLMRSKPSNPMAPRTRSSRRRHGSTGRGFPALGIRLVFKSSKRTYVGPGSADYLQS